MVLAIVVVLAMLASDIFDNITDIIEDLIDAFSERRK